MQQQSSKKPILITLVVLVLVAGGYFYMSGNSIEDTSAGLVAVPGAIGGVGNGATSEVGARVLTLLRQVNSLKIDGDFFKTDAYRSLVDHTVPIYDQNIGKRNPFVSRSSATVPAVTSTAAPAKTQP